MKIIKWGVIGCDEPAARLCQEVLSRVPGSEVVAVMCRSLSRAQEYAGRLFLSRYYDDAQELIDDTEVNAVYVPTPSSTHATFAVMSMLAGKPVCVTTPLAASYDDCVRINRVSEQTGVPCFVTYYKRHLPYFQRVKELLAQHLGQILNIQLRLGVDMKADGGGLYDFLPHQLDILQVLFGVITHVHGFSERCAGLDAVSACFKFEGGALGSGSWTFSGDHLLADDCVEVTGTAGKLVFSVFGNMPIQLTTPRGVEEVAVPLPSHEMMPMMRAVVEDLQGFNICNSRSVSATPVNWVIDRILN